MPASPCLAYWVHNCDPFLVRFTEHIGIRYYGLAYLLGFVGAGWLLHLYHRHGRSTLDADSRMDLLFYLVAGVFLGGRLGSYLLYDGWRNFAEDPLAILRIWEGGMASHGGFLGVILALWLFARRTNTSFLSDADLVVTTVPLGLLLGRVANFINGELWGRMTTVPWGVIFERTGGGKWARHPSQLYEAALEGLLLLALCQWRFWRTDVARTTPGRLGGEFLVAYAVVRFVGEAYREPDAGLILGLSRGSFYSLFLLAGGLAVIGWAAARKPQSAD